MRTVVSNEIALASPRISTPPVALALSLTHRKDSESPPRVWRENVPGISGEGIARKDS
jgi:hypothetical protein